jgi:hypothetical protein
LLVLRPELLELNRARLVLVDLFKDFIQGVPAALRNQNEISAIIAIIAYYIFLSLLHPHCLTDADACLGRACSLNSPCPTIIFSALLCRWLLANSKCQQANIRTISTIWIKTWKGSKDHTNSAGGILNTANIVLSAGARSVYRLSRHVGRESEEVDQEPNLAQFRNPCFQVSIHGNNLNLCAHKHRYTNLSHRQFYVTTGNYYPTIFTST